MTVAEPGVTPDEVNDEVLSNDGRRQSSESFNSEDIYTGRVQFQPEIAVDPVTGTVVVSWRDGRDDAARSQVATYPRPRASMGGRHSALRLTPIRHTLRLITATRSNRNIGPE